MSYIPLGTVTAPEYGWVTAKANETDYFAKRDQDYFNKTGKHIDPSWNGWTKYGESYLTQEKALKSRLSPKGNTQNSNRFNTNQDIRLHLYRPKKIPGLYEDPRTREYINRGLYYNSLGQKTLSPDRFEGRVKEKTLDLANPLNYSNPELQRYMDGPNSNLIYDMTSGEFGHTGNNTSKTLGGEDLADEVAQWYKQHNTDPNFANTYGSLVSKNGNQYTFDKDGVATNYFYTPYDVAIHGTKQDGIANQDINFWNDKPFYENGFLSSIDPGLKPLGSETTTLGVRTPPKSGGLFGGGILSTIAGLGLNYLAPGAGTIFNGAVNLGKVLDGPDSMSTKNPFQGFNPYQTPNSGLSSSTTNATSGGTTPNILNPGTGGSNQTTTSLNKFNWNNEDFNVQNNGLYRQNGDLAYNRETNTGTSQLGQAYNTYLGTL